GLNHMDKTMRHRVTCAKGSLMHRLFGESVLVNSTHHQAVKNVAPGFWVTALSEEGIVEAYEHSQLPIWATQFHPERLTGTWSDGRTPDFAPLFEFFVEQVMKIKAAK
ncbi:MAG: gamma-glutamyl-gamma-aminobutyrate hydrolase family protein, partial [Oscillospiraceae bacterium]|nr:gamma-glutamyl-gamma-aminobutyrate hydrolase family protein [Oscillospiraceae bacterium]